MSDPINSRSGAYPENEYGFPVQVLPNVWVIPVPIPIPALRYVLVYVFVTNDGIYLVDTGWDDDASWDALCIGLERIGASVMEVRGALITHFHSDHYGLAGRVREASGAWIALHSADVEFMNRRNLNAQRWIATIEDYVLGCGVPSPWDRELVAIAEKQASRPITQPDIAFDDDYQPHVPGWILKTVRTPGHSPGHVCFYLVEHKRLLSGDHVLPRISPNVSYEGTSDSIPLRDYLESLERLEALDVIEVLPAHQWPFGGLNQRVVALKAHHDLRMAEIEAALASEPSTAWDIAKRLTWSRAWESFNGQTVRSALGETTAHLQLLMVQGHIRTVSNAKFGTPLVFELTGNRVCRA